ncbi:hypothetical protein KY362_08405, partial [Candidatus Woesearchaeota archaeon]|nr:hypothetical protein [Candidatus Woesearchaeota archaeon]
MELRCWAEQEGVSIERLEVLDKQISEARQSVEQNLVGVGDAVSRVVQCAVADGLERYVLDTAEQMGFVPESLPPVTAAVVRQLRGYLERQQFLRASKEVFEVVFANLPRSLEEDGLLGEDIFAEAEELLKADNPYFPHESNYSRWMLSGEPEIVDRDGRQMLHIYRGLVVPTEWVRSEGDGMDRRPGVIDLKNPGVDWTPIRAYAEDYANDPPSMPGGDRVLLSALIPLDDPDILERAIEINSRGLDERDWHQSGVPVLKSLRECLIIEVYGHQYGLLEDIRIE